MSPLAAATSGTSEDPSQVEAIVRIAPTDWRNALSLQRNEAGSSGERGNAGRCEDGRGLSSLTEMVNSANLQQQRRLPEPAEG
jgi:hypothetical protein